MAHFVELDDSPMFQKRICSLEQSADELKERCQKLYKGCKKFMAALGEAYMGDVTFADSLQAFGGGQDDLISFSVGGPIISRFINVIRELAGHKELLRSQVEHVLVDRLMHFMTADLQDVKECRRQFDKAVNSYDQARDKFVSLKKNTRGDIVAELEEDLQNSKSAFEKSRFNLVNALMNIEAKKKYEFLESLSAIMDAHLRYFKLGYELLSQMEPYIHQILTYAQQSKEFANVEKDKLAKRIQEFRTQAEMENLKASSKLDSPKSAGRHVIGLSSYKNNQAMMLAKTNGEMIKKGYLLKRSSTLRGDWKRRFFVLDTPGTLYYYTNKPAKQLFQGSHHHRSVSAEPNNSMFARFRSKYTSSTSLNDDNLNCRTVDLQTSMIKMDAEDKDLRLCFRIISPSKTYTLQAENEVDRMDWVNKITGAIASLLNSHIMQQPHQIKTHLEKSNSGQADVSDIRSPGPLDSSEAGVVATLRDIPGNDICAECSSPDPDWASLNLGILLCIQCSGVHRNLGVHISKVRSLTLDVKVWEHTILELFRALGNTYCNSIWEGRLLLENDRVDDKTAFESLLMKPCRSDTFYHKEKYTYAKYVDKFLLVRNESVSGNPHKAKSIWEAVKNHNLREVYHIIATSDACIINTTFDDAVSGNVHHHVADVKNPMPDGYQKETRDNDPAACQKINESNDPGNCLQGCSLLHLACHLGDAVMIELLLLSGADIHLRDFHGRTPLHLCIAEGNNQLAKFLLRRGARASIKDGGGLSALERAMEKGAITDEQLFILLSEC